MMWTSKACEDSASSARGSRAAGQRGEQKVDQQRVGKSYGLVVAPPLVAFRVAEATQGDTDLNGDGDTTDRVLVAYDLVR